MYDSRIRLGIIEGKSAYHSFAIDAFLEIIFWTLSIISKNSNACIDTSKGEALAG